MQTNICPHCGTKIENVPAVDGSTIVVDAEVLDFVIDFPSGYVRKKKGRKVHSCSATGENGHVVK